MSQVICKLSTLFPNSLEVGNRFKNIISKYMIVFSFQIVFPKNSSKCGLGLTLLEYGYVFFFSVITAWYGKKQKAITYRTNHTNMVLYRTDNTYGFVPYWYEVLLNGNFEIWA